jgi:hypothetical protein
MTDKSFTAFETAPPIGVAHTLRFDPGCELENFARYCSIPSEAPSLSGIHAHSGVDGGAVTPFSRLAMTVSGSLSVLSSRFCGHQSRQRY